MCDNKSLAIAEMAALCCTTRIVTIWRGSVFRQNYERSARPRSWIIQGGSKKVSCWHSTTAYFFWATLYNAKKQESLGYIFVADTMVSIIAGSESYRFGWNDEK